MIRGPDEAQQPPDDLDECVEILTCVRRNETRVYRLRIVTGGAELWRTSQSDAGGIQSLKESDFRSSEQVTAFLEELRRSLIAGGWREG